MQSLICIIAVLYGINSLHLLDMSNNPGNTTQVHLQLFALYTLSDTLCHSLSINPTPFVTPFVTLCLLIRYPFSLPFQKQHARHLKLLELLSIQTYSILPRCPWCVCKCLSHDLMAHVYSEGGVVLFRHSRPCPGGWVHCHDRNET